MRRCLKLSLSEWKVHMTTGLQVPNEKPPQTVWVGALGESEREREKEREGKKNSSLDWHPVTVINFTNRPV